MYILSKTPTEEGQYPPIEVHDGLVAPDGYYWWPDYLEQETFEQYEGFIVPEIKRDTVASYTANAEAYEAWKEAHPEPEPEPASETQLLGQEITNLQLAEIEQGQYATDLDLRIREMEESSNV